MININKYIKIIVVSFLLVGCSSLFAQSKQDTEVDKGSYRKIIKGVVVDEDGNWVKDADVIIPEKNIVTKTNKTGNFVFEISGGGAIHVEVYKKGYLPASTKIIKIAKRDNIKVSKFVLSKSFLEEIVVTGTATPKLYREAPVKTFIASKKDIEKKGAQNLADSLEIVTGVRVENNCQNCNFTQVRINGMEGKYCQVLINGMPVVSALAGVYALEQIPANMIEKFEVVKGGGSSLYGGNAVGGVVNVMLREATKSGIKFSINREMIKNKPNTSLNLNYDYIAPNPNTKASLFSNFQRREPVDYDGDGFSDLGELSLLSVGSNFSHFFNKVNGDLKLSFSVISEERRGGNKFDLPEHYADIAESIRTKRLDFFARWEQTFSKVSILKINSSFSYTKRKSYYGSGQDPNAYGDTENPVFYGELQYYNFSLTNHSVIAGLSFKSDEINDFAPAYDRIIDETYRNFGFYLQDEINFGQKLKLLFGVRGDRHSEIENIIFSPRVSISFTGLKDFTLRFTYSTGFRAPQVFDEDLHITQVGGEGMTIVNRAGLKEEKSYSLTFGLDFGKQVKNKLYRFSIGGFYNRLNDVFTLDEVDSSGDYMLMERFNSDGAKIYGVELEAGFQIGGVFEIFTGWTLQRSEYDTPEPDFNSMKIFRTPELYGSLRFNWDIKNFPDINVDLNYTGPMKAPHYAGYITEDVLEDTDPFIVVNIKLIKRFELYSKNSITMTASLLNAFDSFQKDLDKGIYRDAGYVYGPRIPRTFRVGIKYDF